MTQVHSLHVGTKAPCGVLGVQGRGGAQSVGRPDWTANLYRREEERRSGRMEPRGEARREARRASLRLGQRPRETPFQAHLLGYALPIMRVYQLNEAIC